MAANEATRRLKLRRPAVLSLPSRATLSVVAARARTSGPTLLGVVAIVGIVVGLGALPARTWVAQRDAIDRTTAELGEVQADVEALQAELDLLLTDAEIERQARQNFDLVYPGEESFRILPAPSD